MTWLEHLYGGEEIPEFEVNERTIEILHSLMVKNETKNRETQLVTDDLNQKTTEYTAEGVYLQLSHLSNSSHQCRFLSRLSNSSHQCRFLSLKFIKFLSPVQVSVTFIKFLSPMQVSVTFIKF